ncbi:phosphotransferase enzyme family protein [Robiginitalea sp. SC105]|uniref:phosphotransferase enzyme family protein n=1 Tax=Robiginitalea sp. SC105 TaxID=2762332 RepID=UPI00163AD93D|nr:aminoglycoside phosphotransferase family protein [Robiginitalea sp. SC105]MBC2838646.1 aminoglycoside phosphotransferase family protein [Robiginitalea sp. SC105]
MKASDPVAALSLFGIPTGDASLQPISDGYINDTYKVVLPGEPGYILQRINTEVFPDPGLLMHNLEEVLPRLRGEGYHPPELVRTPEGASWATGPGGHSWRVYRFIEGSFTLSVAGAPGISREAGRILGRFHKLLEGTPADLLEPVLPGFHDLGLRMGQLGEAAHSGLPERVQEGGELLALGRELSEFLRQANLDELPLRICHNDPKLSNVLFEQATSRALCLIDLDTLMPGYLVYDFGDAVRSVVTPLPEDHPDPGELDIDLENYRAFCAGFASCGLALQEGERNSLPYGLVLMPLLHGVRALADYFLGDRYYKTAFEGQNLLRAKNLLGLARLAAGRMEELTTIWKTS